MDPATPRLGDVAPLDIDGRWCVGRFAYWNRDTPSWGMPDWEERGYAGLHGFFASKADAQAAIDSDDWWTGRAA